MLDNAQPSAHGNIASEAKAGTRQMTGASMKMGLSAAEGMMSSLKKLLMPSAMGCSSPSQPTRVGPMRICIWPMTLRSKYVA